MYKIATPIFDHIHPKIIEITFRFPQFLLAKNQFIPSTFPWDTVNFRVLWPDWPHQFLTTPTPKFFDQLLLYVNLYQHLKNQAILLMVDWKTQQSDWLRTFWPISQEQKFSQKWDLCSNTAKYINFHYRTNPVKFNDKVFQ